MPTPLRVLILEDRPVDAELMALELLRAGFAPEWRCVSTESDYLAALDTPIDVILADFRLPGFTALEAFRHTQERNLDLPFIIVTGSLGDEMAAQCIKQGITDYLLKDRMSRLGPAVANALEQKQLRGQRKRAEAQREAVNKISLAVIDSFSLQETVQRILQILCESLRWEWSAVWRVDKEAGVLRCMDCWHTPSTVVPEFEAMSRSVTFPPGIGLPGRVWASGQPAFIPDIAADKNFPRAPAAVPNGMRAAFAFPIHHTGGILGVMEFFSRETRLVSVDDFALVTTIDSVIGQQMERALVHENLKESHEQLRALAKRLLEVQEEERRLLARELHDEVGQQITAIKLNLQLLQASPDPARAAARFKDSIGIADHLLTLVRARSLDLRPPLLDELGLGPALESFVRVQTRRAGLALDLAIEPNAPRLPAPLEIAAFRVVQESLTNVIRHAQATRVAVAMQHTRESVALTVRDDGRGFDMQAMLARAKAGEHAGLMGLRERANLFSGDFAIESAPGRGTEVRVTFPLEPAS
jgi:two-component system sensor histidine kinase UhpB